MLSTSLSFEGLSPANALGASLGRGLVTLSHGGRFGNDTVKHVVTTQGLGATVNVEDMVALMKTLLSSTSPRDLEYGGQDSDIVKTRIWDVSRSFASTMTSNPPPRTQCDCCGWAAWEDLRYLTCVRFPESSYHDCLVCYECDDGATKDVQSLGSTEWERNQIDSKMNKESKFNRVTGDHFRALISAQSVDELVGLTPVVTEELSRLSKLPGLNRIKTVVSGNEAHRVVRKWFKTRQQISLSLLGKEDMGHFVQEFCGSGCGWSLRDHTYMTHYGDNTSVMAMFVSCSELALKTRIESYLEQFKLLGVDTTSVIVWSTLMKWMIDECSNNAVESAAAVTEEWKFFVMGDRETLDSYLKRFELIKTKYQSKLAQSGAHLQPYDVVHAVTAGLSSRVEGLFWRRYVEKYHTEVLDLNHAAVILDSMKVAENQIIRSKPKLARAKIDFQDAVDSDYAREGKAAVGRFNGGGRYNRQVSRDDGSLNNVGGFDEEEFGEGGFASQDEEVASKLNRKRGTQRHGGGSGGGGAPQGKPGSNPCAFCGGEVPDGVSGPGCMEKANGYGCDKYEGWIQFNDMQGFHIRQFKPRRGVKLAGSPLRRPFHLDNSGSFQLDDTEAFKKTEQGKKLIKQWDSLVERKPDVVEKIRQAIADKESKSITDRVGEKRSATVATAADDAKEKRRKLREELHRKLAASQITEGVIKEEGGKPDLGCLFSHMNLESSEGSSLTSTRDQLMKEFEGLEIEHSYLDGVAGADMTSSLSSHDLSLLNACPLIGHDDVGCAVNYISQNSQVIAEIGSGNGDQECLHVVGGQVPIEIERHRTNLSCVSAMQVLFSDFELSVLLDSGASNSFVGMAVLKKLIDHDRLNPGKKCLMKVDWYPDGQFVKCANNARLDRLCQVEFKGMVENSDFVMQPMEFFLDVLSECGIDMIYGAREMRLMGWAPEWSIDGQQEYFSIRRPFVDRFPMYSHSNKVLSHVDAESTLMPLELSWGSDHNRAVYANGVVEQEFKGNATDTRSVYSAALENGTDRVSEATCAAIAS